MKKLQLLFFIILMPFISHIASAEVSRLPDADLNLKLDAPINSWDEAIPLGNGLLGGLLWGNGALIRLSLDRGDLWDERPADGVRWKDFNYATMIRLVKENKNGELNSIFDHPYNDKHPTKIPAGRLEIALDPSRQIKSFELNLASAQGRVLFADGRQGEAFFSAAQPVALMRIAGEAPTQMKLAPPASVKQLGYPDPKTGAEGEAQWFMQEAAQGLSYCVCLAARRSGGATVLAVTVVSSKDGADPVKIARDRVAAALDAGYEKMLEPHLAYWKNFWSQSAVMIPGADVHILRHYYLVQYFYGAASRRNAPPMPLQGVWTADAGGLPPWKGDYHNDLNTQMTYIAYQASGRFEEGRSFLDFMWDLLPVFRKFAKDFYGAPGAAVPGVMSLAGQALGGWGQYSLSPTMGAWNGHLFYLHWRYTGDDQFLKERAYPWCREVGTCLRSMLKPDANGVLKLPLSTSPEIFDNSARAWLTPNTNYDRACMRMFFMGLAEMAQSCGDADEAGKWRETARALGDFQTNTDGVLKLDANLELPGSHRHLSNIMSMHPFNLITTDGGEPERRIIAASLRQWDKFGTGAWCGYSFSWMACLRARVGDAEAALRNLDIYARAFILRNGFHANGDQTRSGFSGFTYRPFTLEGNFLAAQAVHEMLLQSWNAAPGASEPGVIRIFPATPWRWHEAAFEDLRAEGGHRVSARRENNATTWFKIVAGGDGVVRIRDNFGGREIKWSREGAKKAGDNFEIALKKGETIEATLPKPAAPPDAPANAAEPVVIRKPSTITANQLPLRIGADSQGASGFVGDIGRVSVFSRALTADEIKRLADRQNGKAEDIRDCVLSLDYTQNVGGVFTAKGAANLSAKSVGAVQIVEAGDGLPGKAIRLDGKGYLEIANTKALDCLGGVTLEAWIKPGKLPERGARIIDKSPVGAATGYNLDTYPGHSLRMIVRDPWINFDAKLPQGQWSHVAGAANGATGKTILYINGKPVKESE
ncbi:MAG: glycoside hydrolase N-terminal domain-containing protein [Candidatus Sumerlaeota bacterium]|nr:glycoside hydrolase N-terminal domain-containing protein [Candidatus Sumerlaeota bacterium]